MKKGVLIFVIIILLILLGGGIYYFWINSEKNLKKNIETAIYEDQFLEICKLRAYKGFDSRENCEGAVRCISLEMTELVKKEDLKVVSDKMKWSEDAESIIVSYVSDSSDIESQKLDSIMNYCFNQYNYNSTSS